MSDINTTQSLGGSYLPGPVEIAGYTLEHRLGIGGYGEVWQATGPGGLPKAVKILFGQQDGPQADSERKSLELMKNLRHPFLLNIERIEVVDGRMVVVTELADGSLEERFDQVQKKKQKGIPRDELLGYLKDAADALDFMSEEHGLQHLDIKPENLMLQGNHVKVGDFGLAKDISVTTMSLVGGFTPLYAPPEIYEGQPGRHSDQYSLAIVYQQMLTGQPPFAGRTPAQLAAQHLNSSPDLSPLQASDRPVIARALSKNPNARFPSCRDFVDALIRRRGSEPEKRKAAPSTPEQPAAAPAADVGSETIVHAQPLPPADPDGAARFRPTVFVGVGGLGGQVVKSLRTRVRTHFDDGTAEAFGFLYIDSDRAAVNAACSASQQRLSDREVLATPLRSSDEYRRDANLNLQWLSRRWLFNMPRSGQVEGIRPLGRLALMDHRENVCRRLRGAIEAANEDGARSDTGKCLNSPLAEGVDVVVVGSTAGGTGSGSLIDTANLVRHTMDEMSITESNVVAVLLHATGSQADIGDIQRANTISFLSELKHNRLQNNDQPAAFDHTYLVHLGDELNGPDFGRKTDSIVDYLLTATLTEGRAPIEHWRSEDPGDSACGGVTIRTLGCATVDDALSRVVQREAASLCYAVAQQWSAGGSFEDDLTETQQLVITLRLGEARLSAAIMAFLRGDAAAGIESWAQQRWHNMSGSANVESSEQLFAALDNAITDQADPSVARIMNQARAVFPTTPELAASQIDEHLIAQLDQPGRFGRAAAASAVIATEIERSLAACRKLLGDVEASVTGVRESAGADQAANLEVWCTRYCTVRFYEEIYRALVRQLTLVHESLRQVTEQLETSRASIRTFAADFIDKGEVPSSQPETLIDAFDARLRAAGDLSLSDLCRSAVSSTDAHRALLGAAETFMLANLGQADMGDDQADRSFPATAAPDMPPLGGGQRVVAVASEPASIDRWRDKLESTFGPCISARVDQHTKQVSVICEIEGVAIADVVGNLARHNPRLLDIASRIHTRVDVDW